MSTEENDKRVTSTRNVIDSLQIFVENNHRIIKSALYLTGGLVAVYVARKIHMTAVFQNVAEIPEEFIQKAVRLQGHVKSVCDDGALYVQHIPILELRVPFKKRKDKGCLSVNIACIDMSPEGRVWLNENVLNRTVWFHLLHRGNNQGEVQLYSKVDIPRFLRRNLCVNEELLRKGLCKIWQLSKFQDFDISSNQNMVRYLDRLVKMEHHAARKGVGMWTQTEETSLSRKGLKVTKNILFTPFYILTWIYKKLRKK